MRLAPRPDAASIPKEAIAEAAESLRWAVESLILPICAASASDKKPLFAACRAGLIIPARNLSHRIASVNSARTRWNSVRTAACRSDAGDRAG